MKRDQVLKILAANRDDIQRRFHVRSLSLFGSVARDQADQSSDVDILVEYQPGSPSGLFEFMALSNHLEDLLGCSVDLVMSESIPEESRGKLEIFQVG